MAYSTNFIKLNLALKFLQTAFKQEKIEVLVETEKEFTGWILFAPKICQESIRFLALKISQTAFKHKKTKF